MPYRTSYKTVLSQQRPSFDESKRAPGFFNVLEENILIDYFNKIFEICSSA